MMSRLESIGRGSQALALPRVRVPLHAYVFSSGWTLETDSRYDWDGLKRGERPFVLFQYTVAGEGRLRHGDREHRVCAGQAMVLRFPRPNRYWIPKGSPGWDFLYLCLQGAEILRLWDEFERIAGPLVTLPEASAAVDHAIGIYERMKGREWRTAYEASQDAYGFAMALAREICGDAPVRVTPDWLARVEQHLKSHLDRDLTVDGLSALSGYSRYHFSRLFEHHTGKSPMSYLLDLRMKRAASLLHQEGLAIREVAVRCGFQDANYFSKAFRKAFGMSPLDYRRGGF